MIAACSSTLAASGPGSTAASLTMTLSGVFKACTNADLGARAFHHVAIGVNQQIEFAGEWREILREIAFDFIGFAAPYRGDPFLQLPKRLAKLRRRRHNEGQCENREGNHEIKLETGNLRFDFLGRRGNLNEINSLIAGINDAFEHSHDPVIWPRRIASPRAGWAGRHAGIAQTWKLCREQRARTSYLCLRHVQLICQYQPDKAQFELRLA
jgi:hypothetical protein